ncbi:matrix metalloproteinase-2-like [Anopheles bellator]|uniref:matrix metalloproteinase-2-like n=1 Tax=Anopheles bellator TaxID=139047 RepID=UPI002649D988|nr:matrix metalloproteinase-2-like [Anopheles bellator]
MRSCKRRRHGRIRTKRRTTTVQPLYHPQIPPVWGRPRRCVWMWLLTLQLSLVVDEWTHKRYEIVALPLVDAAEQRSPEAKFWDYDDGVQNYLMRYGYLEKSNIETGNLRTIDELQQAVRKLQMYGHLEPTGTVDEATLELMRKPRCGAPDVPDSLDFLPSNDRRLGKRRFRRYVIQGQKWQNSVVTWR